MGGTKFEEDHAGGLVRSLNVCLRMRRSVLLSPGTFGIGALSGITRYVARVKASQVAARNGPSAMTSDYNSKNTRGARSFAVTSGNRVHNEQWSIFSAEIDPPNIFAYNAQGNHLKKGNDDDGKHEPRPYRYDR